MLVSVKHNLDALAADVRAFQSDLVDKATVSALNKVAAKVKTEASRQIRDAGYRLKARDVKAKIDIVSASRARLTARVVASGRPFPLILFLVRETDQGVIVDVKGTPKLIPHLFVATMPSGHRGIFERRSKSRLPIEEKYTIGVPPMFASKTVTAALQQLVADDFPGILAHEIEYRQFLKLKQLGS